MSIVPNPTSVCPKTDCGGTLFVRDDYTAPPGETAPDVDLIICKKCGTVIGAVLPLAIQNGLRSMLARKPG